MNIIQTIQHHAATHQGYIYIIIVAAIGYGIIFKFEAKSAMSMFLKYVLAAACCAWLYFRIVG